MENVDFLRKYQQLQYKIMFDEISVLEGAVLGISHLDQAAFWNFALACRNISAEELREIERKMESVGRKPVVYVENSRAFSETAKLLKSRQYQKIYEDSWMFWGDHDISSGRFFQVKKIGNPDELAVYLKTFDSCFRNDDPQNPYGELGDYLKVAEKSWHEHHGTNRLEYFVAYKNDKPVAVATLTNFDGLGYISNVGSLKEVRGEGFGKLATLYCVAASKNRGNSLHFLATEENTYPNEFYKRIGFETRFSAIAYIKE